MQSVLIRIGFQVPDALERQIAEAGIHAHKRGEIECHSCQTKFAVYTTPGDENPPLQEDLNSTLRQTCRNHHDYIWFNK